MTLDNLQSFNGDLRAAVRAGVKLEIGEKSTPGSALSIRKLERLEKQIASGQEVPARYQAAIETWQKTGTMVPILEGLSTRINAWIQIDRLFRKALIYVLIVAALGIIGLIYFQTSVLPQIEMIRNDLATIARPAHSIEPSSVGLWSQVLLFVYVVVMAVLVYWFFSAGTARVGLFAGGGNYMRCRSLATATQSMQLLVAAGTDPQQAATIGGCLAGLDELGQSELIYSIKDIDHDAILSPVWVDYLLMIADRQYLKARVWGPTALVVTIGGTVAFLYVVLAYWPIVSLFNDMTNFGGAGL